MGISFKDIDRKKLIALFNKYTIPEPNSGCYIWLGNVDSRNYGRVCIDYQQYYAHRLSYTLKFGAIPGGKLLMHSCDNPCCVNPHHLTPGTYQENNADMMKKGRHKARKAKQKHIFLRGSAKDTPLSKRIFISNSS